MSGTKKIGHTPGPWEVAATIIHGTNYGNTGVRTVSEDGYELCRGSWARTLVTVPHDMRTLDPVIEANLRLMAAAPELLAALKSLRNEIVGQLGIAREEIREAISTTNLRCIENRIEQAEAIIAQAEGL